MVTNTSEQTLKTACMKTIETEITINCEPSAVWKILADFEKYPEWNPFIKSISGDRFQGGKLVVELEPPEGKRMKFNPDVLNYEENREIRWKGKLGIKGIFDGEHYLILNDNRNGTTTFIHGEKINGILVPFVGGTLTKTRFGFEFMNLSLKERCEQ